jgi:hypothetical protein
MAKRPNQSRRAARSRTPPVAGRKHLTGLVVVDSFPFRQALATNGALPPVR